MDPKVIQRVIRMNTKRFRDCYNDGLKRNPKLSGKLKVRFTIDIDGTVDQRSRHRCEPS